MTIENPTGIEPIDLRVLVKPDPVKERTSGGIILADVTKEADEWATTRGTLIAVGGCAWAEQAYHARQRGEEFNAPKPGARVLFAKYGQRAEVKVGDDKYWFMNDEDVIGIEACE